MPQVPHIQAKDIDKAYAQWEKNPNGKAWEDTVWEKTNTTENGKGGKYWVHENGTEGLKFDKAHWKIHLNLHDKIDNPLTSEVAA